MPKNRFIPEGRADWVLRQRAHAAVYNAKQRGDLLEPEEHWCADKCGRRAREYDHYLGYAKANWLSVEPVCKACHNERTQARMGRIAQLPRCEGCGHQITNNDPRVMCTPCVDKFHTHG